MKKLLALLLALVMVLSLVACGEKDTKPAEEKKPDKEQKTQQEKKEETKKPDKEEKKSEKKDSEAAPAGPAGWYAAMKLNLPDNLYVEYKIGGATVKIWKIGDEYVQSSYGDYSYYRYEDGMWKEFQNYDDKWEWLDYGSENSVVAPALLSFLKEQKNLKGEVAYYTSTGETQEICGKTCVKYHEDHLGDIWVYEDAGFCFEIWMEGADKAMTAVSVWEEGTAEFPIEIPN